MVSHAVCLFEECMRELLTDLSVRAYFHFSRHPRFYLLTKTIFCIDAYNNFYNIYNIIYIIWCVMRLDSHLLLIPSSQLGFNTIINSRYSSCFADILIKIEHEG